MVGMVKKLRKPIRITVEIRSLRRAISGSRPRLAAAIRFKFPAGPGLFFPYRRQGIIATHVIDLQIQIFPALPSPQEGPDGTNSRPVSSSA